MPGMIYDRKCIIMECLSQLLGGDTTITVREGGEAIRG